MVLRPTLKIVDIESNSEQCHAVSVNNFNTWFFDSHILSDVSVNFQKNKINCIIGPSGSGKSTLIRCINRINDGIEGFDSKGIIHFENRNIFDKSIDVTNLRKEIGMVFQKPCVFPKSISCNVLFGIQHIKKLSKIKKRQIVEEYLRVVSLWEEVLHRLNDHASSLSIGQQQRLAIARTLAVEPKVILLDEPTSSIDPISTRAIENLMLQLKEKYTIIFVTHNIKQAKRIADYLVFLCDGKIIEQGSKEKLFTCPESDQTKTYLNSEYCKC